MHIVLSRINISRHKEIKWRSLPLQPPHQLTRVLSNISFQKGRRNLLNGYANLPSTLVVVRMIRIRQIKHHTRMWLRAPTIGKLPCEVNRAIEV